MVDTVRNSPNAGTSTLRPKKVARIASGSIAIFNGRKATASAKSVSVDLSVSEKVKSCQANLQLILGCN